MIIQSTRKHNKKNSSKTKIAMFATASLIGVTSQAYAQEPVVRNVASADECSPTTEVYDALNGVCVLTSSLGDSVIYLKSATQSSVNNNYISIQANGSAAQTSGQGAIAIGGNSISAGGDNEESALAIGFTAKATGKGAVATGAISTANGDYTTAVGNSSLAGSSGASAFGYNAKAHAKDSLALGSNATINTGADGAVALGSNSIANQANTVSVGSSTLKRKIVNVAAATLNNTSTDAVIGSQLFATNNKVTALETRMTTAEGTAGINVVKQDSGSGLISIGSATNGTVVSFSGTAGVRTLDNVAEGAINVSSNEVVTGKQLYETNTNINNLVGRVNNTETALNDLGIIMTTTTQNVDNLETDVQNLSTHLASAETKIGDFELGFTQAQQDLSDITNQATGMGQRLNDTETQLTDIYGRLTLNENQAANFNSEFSIFKTAIDAGTIGLVQQDEQSQLITVAADKAGTSVSFKGVDGNRKLTDLADATLSEDSTDAVTGNQLYTTNNVISGINIRLDQAQAQVDDIDGRLVQQQTDITSLQTDMTTLTENLNITEAGLSTARTNIDQTTTDVASLTTRTQNSEDEIVTINNNLNRLTTELVSGDIGLVQQDGITAEIKIAADKTGQSVSLMGAEGNRTLAGVKEAILSAESTEAVTGKQLYETNESITQLDTRLTTNEDNISGLDTRVHNVETDFNGLTLDVGQIDVRVTQTEGDISNLAQTIQQITNDLNAGGIGLVQQHLDTKQITVAASLAGDQVSFTGTAGHRKLTGIAAGDLTESSSDAVTGAQLWQTNQQMTTIDQRLSTEEININNIDGRLTTSETNFSNLRTDVTNIDGRLNTTENLVTNIDQRVQTNTNHLNNMNTTIENINQSITTGSIGLVQQDIATQAISVAQKSGGTEVSLLGTDGVRSLTGLADARLSDTSTDAVTGKQLYQTNQAVGSLSVRMNDAEQVIGQSKQRLDSVENQIEQFTNTLDTITNDLSQGYIGLVRQDTATNLITVAANTGGNILSIAGVDGTRTLTGVKDGMVAQGSTEAVTGNQLYSLEQQITKSRQDLNTINNRINNIVKNQDQFSGAGIAMNNNHYGNAQATGEDALALGSGSVASGKGSVSVGTNAKAGGNNAVALGNNSNASGNGAVAIGGDSSAMGDNATAIGNNSRANGKNSVALGANSVADRDNTVSVGSLGNERQVTNVAEGTEGTDAVNVNQLNRNMNQVNKRIDDVNKRVTKMNNKLNAGVASAMAMSSTMQANTNGASMISGGISNYSGESALAVGYSKSIGEGNMVINFKGSVDSRNKFGAAAGFGIEY